MAIMKWSNSFAAGDEFVQLVKRVDQKRQVDEPEARAQVGGGHRADTHALDGAHLELVEDLDLTAQHGKGLVVEVDLAVGPLPEFIPNGETGVDPLMTGWDTLETMHLYLAVERIESRLPLVQAASPGAAWDGPVFPRCHRLRPRDPGVPSGCGNRNAGLPGRRRFLRQTAGATTVFSRMMASA
jgi:hypothetical protein